MASSGKANWAEDGSDSDEDMPQRQVIASNNINNTEAVKQQNPPPAQHIPHASLKYEINPAGPYVLFVGNIPYEATADDLGNFFAQGGCKVLDIKIQLDRETNKPRGFAHVEMCDLPSLEKALTASGHKFMGRNISVDVGRPPKTGSDRNYDRKYHNRDDNNHNNNFNKYGKKDKNDYHRDRKGDQRQPQKSEAVPQGEAAAAAAPVTTERKKLDLKPRSIPIDDANRVAQTNSHNAIFGDGKPREALEDKLSSAAISSSTPPSPPTDATKNISSVAVSASAMPPIPPTSDETTANKAYNAKHSSQQKSANSGRGNGPVSTGIKEGGCVATPGSGRGGRGGDSGRGRGSSGEGKIRDVSGRGGRGKGDGHILAARPPNNTGAPKAKNNDKKVKTAADGAHIEEETKPVVAAATSTNDIKKAKGNINSFAALGSDSDEDN